MRGNAAHAEEIRDAERPDLELGHRERIVAIGQGFDWLHRANYALIVNDLDPQMDDAIGKAVGIIKYNRDKKRVPASGALLFASVCYYTRQDHHRNAAIARAKYPTRLGLESIRRFHPDAEDFFHPLTAVVNWDTRSLEIVSK